MAVAGQGALGEQVGAAHRAGRLRPAGRRPVGGERGAGGDVRLAEVVGDRADDDRARAELVDHGGGRRPRVVHAAEHDDETVALHGAERVHAGGPRGPAYLVEALALASLGARAAEDDRDVAAPDPAQGAGPGEERLVGVGAQHRVDHERLQAGVPGAADLGGPGVDLGRGEGDLAGVAEYGGADVGSVRGVEDLLEVRLDDVDRQPDQVDGLLEVDDAGERARGRAEDGGDHLAAGRGRLVAREPVPVDEAPDAGLDDAGDPGAVLGAQRAEPRHVLVHPGGRGGG